VSGSSVFDGTWRPDPQRPGPDLPPEDLLLSDGVYACTGCEPPYRIPADGRDHPVAGSARFDTVAITVLDDATVRRVLRKGGEVVVDAITVIDAAGNSKTETQSIADRPPRPFRFAISSQRTGPRPAGGHALSGRWRIDQMDLVDHQEDTRYRIVDGVLSMADGFGRSFDARLDGTPAPYWGDARYTSVSVRSIDETTIEERDLDGDVTVLLLVWRVDPDRGTMHVRFDDLHGHVMEQDGRRL
jgi:hypothetical protein